LNEQIEFAPYKDSIAVWGVFGGEIRVLVAGGVLTIFGAIALPALSLVLWYRHTARAERQQNQLVRLYCGPL
jgi:hypothetical protein